MRIHEVGGAVVHLIPTVGVPLRHLIPTRTWCAHEVHEMGGAGVHLIPMVGGAMWHLIPTRTWVLFHAVSVLFVSCVACFHAGPFHKQKDVCCSCLLAGCCLLVGVCGDMIPPPYFVHMY